MKGVFIMLVRNYVGGVVFSGDKVLLLKNEKDEWVLPRKAMQDGEIPNVVAVKKIEEGSGIAAQIVCAAGQTNYEFSCVTRQKPFCNKTTWYIMKSLNENEIRKKDDKQERFSFFKIDKAMDIISSNQDKSLVNLSFRKYKELI